MRILKKKLFLCVPGTCVGASRGQERESDALEQVLQVIVIWNGCWELNWGSLVEQKVLLASELSSPGADF